MRRLNTYIISLWMTLVIGLFSACREEVDEVVPASIGVGDSVEIVFEVPSCYNYGGVMTRADDGLPDVDFPQTSYHTLPVGSTVWLSYQMVKDANGNAVQMVKDANGNIISGKEETKPYVVRGQDKNNEILTLYACGQEFNEDKSKTWADTTVSGVPLYLEAGTYRFSLISPALEMQLSDGYFCSKVENGIYFCASDIRYPNSRYKDIEVKVNTDGVQRIELQPMVWQVAMFSFIITHDDKIEDLDILPAGIEVSGLQNPVDAQGNDTYFNWRSNNLGDTIPMRMGDKRSWARIKGEDCEVSTTTDDNGVRHTTITGDVGVLPTNGMSTSFVFLFNLSVNGIPTQYETAVNKKIIYHGRNYKVYVTVEGKNKISVMTWFNQSWTATTTLKSPILKDF